MIAPFDRERAYKLWAVTPQPTRTYCEQIVMSESGELLTPCIMFDEREGIESHLRDSTVSLQDCEYDQKAHDLIHEHSWASKRDIPLLPSSLSIELGLSGDGVLDERTQL